MAEGSKTKRKSQKGPEKKQSKLFNFGFRGKTSEEKEQESAESAQEGSTREFRRSWLKDVGDHFIFDPQTETVTCT